MSADVTALKEGNEGIHLRCTVKQTATRRKTIRRVKVVTKSPRKGVDTCRSFTLRDFLF